MKKVYLMVMAVISLNSTSQALASPDTCLVNYGLALSSHPEFDSSPESSIISVLEQIESDVGKVVRAYCVSQSVPQRVCLTTFALGVTSHPEFDEDPSGSIIKVLRQENSLEGKILRAACGFGLWAEVE